MKTRGPKTNRDWEELAQMDALSAILSEPSKKKGNWDIQEFLRTGEAEAAHLLGYLRSQGAGPDFEKVLDFGCGAGRLAAGFCKAAKNYYGVDASPTMLERARRLNPDCRDCNFVLNERNDLSLFEDDFFDLVYSGLVLQHLTPDDGKRYLSEFIRILWPSAHLCFQLPSYVPPIHRLQPRRHLYDLLRRVGILPEFIWRRLGLVPIRTTWLPTAAGVALMTDRGKAIEVRFEKSYATMHLFQKLGSAHRNG